MAHTVAPTGTEARVWCGPSIRCKASSSRRIVRILHPRKGDDWFGWRSISMQRQKHTVEKQRWLTTCTLLRIGTLEKNSSQKKNSDEYPTRIGEMRISSIQPKARLMVTGEVPKVEIVIGKQTKEVYCWKAMTQVRVSEPVFHVRRTLLFRAWTLEGYLRENVLILLRKKVLHAEHYSQLAGHLRNWRMYDRMGKKFFRQYMKIDVYHTARNCATRTLNRKTMKWKRHLQMFSTSGPLEFISMNIFGALLRTKILIFFAYRWRTDIPR